MLVNIYFTYHMRKARNLHETHIYIIDIVLENNNNYSLTNTAYILQYSDTYAR